MVPAARSISTHRHRHASPKYTFFAFILLFFFTARAEYDNLSVLQHRLLDSLLNSYRLDYCCGMAILPCLDLKKECAIARNFQSFAAWLVGTDPDPDPGKVKEQLDLRYNGFTTKETVTIDTTRLQPAGNPKAPVVIVAYVSANCPLCKRVVSALYDSITTGKSLDGKFMLVAKPIGSGIGNVALLAAGKEGKFWDYFRTLANEHSVLKEESDILRVAGKAGITSASFKKSLSDPTLSKRLTKYHEESLKNNVKYTPTFFINNKRYSSYKDPRWVVDAALYEYDRLKKK
jgi:protein-disulfide isomerase